MEIRAAEKKDLEVIADFNIRMAWETEDKELDRQTILAGVEALLNDPLKGRYYLASGNGKVIGQLMITYEWSDWRNETIWWIQSVYVETEFRGQGVYRALYEKVCAEASASGIHTIRLYVEKNNLNAQAVYEKLGMEETVYKMYEVTLQ